MLAEFKSIEFKTCPRCGEQSYETLSTHAYCVNCNYSADEEYRKNRLPRHLMHEHPDPWLRYLTIQLGVFPNLFIR